MTTRTKAKPVLADHAHRWRIEEPHDGLRVLRGACGICGAERDNFAAGDALEGRWDTFSLPRNHSFKGGVRLG